MTDFHNYIFSAVSEQRLNDDLALQMLSVYEARANANRHEAEAIHPLLQRDICTAEQLLFWSCLTGEEFFLADHKVNDKATLPAVAYLEMVGAGLDYLFAGSADYSLENIVFSQPIQVMNENVEVYLSLSPEQGKELAFTIYSLQSASDTEASEQLHVQGKISLATATGGPGVIDLAALQQQCRQPRIAEQCYSRFASMGLSYGPAHRALVELSCGEDLEGRPQVLAELRLPEILQVTETDYGLHPSLLDGALQASIGLAETTDSDEGQAMLPFAIEKLCQWRPLPRRCFVLVKSLAVAGGKLSKCDVELFDSEGRVCVSIKGFSSRQLVNNQVSPQLTTLLLTPAWQPQVLVDANKSANATASTETEYHVVILTDDKAWAADLTTSLSDAHCHLLLRNDINADVAESYTSLSQQLLTHLQSLLSVDVKTDIQLQLIVALGDEGIFYHGFSGLLKSACLEHSRLQAQWIELDGEQTVEEQVQQLSAERNSPAKQIRFHQGQRQTLAMQDLPPLELQGLNVWQEGGVYLLTGGLGGLGLIIAEDIITSLNQGTLVLTGRSVLSEDKLLRLQSLQTRAGNNIDIEYRALNIADQTATTELIGDIIARKGRLNGVIHAAGVLRDSFLRNKTQAELQAVLQAKVSGLVTLDRALANQSLDLFVTFSSLSAVLGNSGQSDYALANGFMDSYMAWRQQQLEQGLRSGISLSLNWPLWAEGGMNIDAASQAVMQDRAGIYPLTTVSGVTALHQAIQSRANQVIVLSGQREKLQGLLRLNFEYNKAVVSQSKDIEEMSAKKEMALDDDATRQNLLAALVEKISIELKVNQSDIDLDAELSEFGFDSVTLTGFGNLLNQTYGLDLTPTVFFEYPTVAAFSDYLLDRHRELINEQFGVFVRVLPESSANEYSSNDEALSVDKEPSVNSNSIANKEPSANKEPLVNKVFSADKKVSAASARSVRRNTEVANEKIAIIGMSGRFPQAEDLQSFWENLQQGRDCIGEIPASRWDWDSLYGDPVTEVNKTNIKHAGLIDGIDEFDPLFFGISPSEAEAMDPQQRLLMTYAWKVIEDAGYAPSSLSGSNTGLFVGTGASGYGGLLKQAGRAIEGYSAAAMVASVGPNRMSFLLNLHGPSEPIETACSSSLVAVHRAVSAMRAGQCDQAIVGGVNTLVTPEAHISFSKAGMLSPDGKCKTFSQAANGYVRGEGIGMLLLKPLAAAERDGDNIYALICGSAENHGGRSNSLTAPNPRAQAELMKTAWRQAGVAPSSIGYIEAHGTGTPLGDPIEIQGLKNAFAELAEEQGSVLVEGSCGIGSVKTNIGHLELAAGVAGLVKVILQMQNKLLVPSLHSQDINQYIDLSDSPLFVVRETQPWPSREDVEGEPMARRAGVSSFGFGGVNAHVVLEEYTGTINQGANDAALAGPQAIVLSAKNPQRLRDQAVQLHNFVARNQGQLNLTSLAYTLQLGRDEMEARLALVVDSIAELEAKLAVYLADGGQSQSVYQGEIKKDKQSLALFGSDEELQQTVNKWLQRGKFDKLFSLWVSGLAVDWSLLYGNNMPKRLSLPSYAFARDSYWVEDGFGHGETGKSFASRLHPLLHENVSDFSEQRFRSRFSGSEFFLADHRVQGQAILPAVAYVEMAREAVCRAVGEQALDVQIALENIVFSQPLVVTDSELEVHIRLQIDAGNQVSFEIFSLVQEQECVHAQGRARLEQQARPASIDLLELQSQIAQPLSVADCYRNFAEAGLDYGPCHRGVVALNLQEVAGTDRKAFAQLKLPEKLQADKHSYYLHPTLMDSALQAAIALVEPEAKRDAMLPFAIESVSSWAPLIDQCWVLVSSESVAASPVTKCDFTIIDTEGNICVQIKGFSSRALHSVSATVTTTDSHQRAIAQVEATVATRVPQSELREKLQCALIDEISVQLKIDRAEIDPQAELSEFGFDSVTLTGFGNVLNQRYGLNLTPTIFFEYPSVALFGDYLVEVSAAALAEHFGTQSGAVTANVETATEAELDQTERSLFTRPARRLGASRLLSKSLTQPQVNSEAIAIIGISGRLPEASDLNDFWQNLSAGRDCIGEIPDSRWDWSSLYGDPATEINKTNIKHAGLIEGIDEFDPLFFGISPSEAEAMDPQQRLLMTYAWQVIEDAGYSAASLSGTDTGLFIGTGASGYGGLLIRAGLPIEGYSAAAMVGSVGPNRMSFLLNLHGPSEPIETACSSSLVAVHRAVSSIHAGHCSQAIVGGINTLVTPEAHISFNKAGMLADDGRCKTFSQAANGYVRGEGVGMLLLKPLQQAELDGDHIYGLIRGTAENHGGRANSLTAPNPRAQAELIKTAYRQAGIDPNSISYIEAHGTGTPLGDPIEVQGLKNAFAELSAEQGSELAAGFCGIGSVKTNIGHLELAAGVAGILKVLLQMKHESLVPSLHCQQLNSYIELQDSPFYLVDKTQPWLRLQDSSGAELPRRAGVSSFGFGGVNAHVLLEEYRAQAIDVDKQPKASVIVLSAKNSQRLLERAQQLHDFLQVSDVTPALDSLAYTLQLGRDAMDSRLAFIVESVEQLQQKLAAFLGGDEQISDCYSGEAKKHKEALAPFSLDTDLQDVIGRWMVAGKLDKLAKLWTTGLVFDWSLLYGDDQPQRMSLPAYPFARDRYWPPAAAQVASHAGIDTAKAAVEEAVTQSRQASVAVVQQSAEHAFSDDLRALLERKLAQLLSDITKLPIEKIEADEPLEDYGIDSVMITQLNQNLSSVFADLSKTLFYEYRSLAAVTDYLLNEENDVCRDWCLEQPIAIQAAAHQGQPAALSMPGELETPASSQLRLQQQNTWRQCLLEEEEVVQEPIAIIGLAGRYAKSPSLDAYWENLKNGVDCIGEIPAERWDIDGFYDADQQEGIKQGKSYSKWGGFIEGFSEFDPMFFNITPREAQMMDPQERIFTQACWSVLEDAGYTRERLASQHQSRVGVFVGITKTGFALYGPDLWRQGEDACPNTSFGSVANRVSYLFNLCGPSMPIDTMCSASLTAIHEACEHILRGECELALTGGVNLYLHPSSYVLLCGQQMLSPDGQCKSFGAGGNGFVPGEGVGAILLKRLSQAEADGDHIYGVIRGTSVNHGGKTNGYTVPNPLAHKELISAALKKAEVHPRTLSYIEAHGTGTSLGDPIEVTGLTQAFKEQTDAVGYCALGSAKSNIGHCESAAGIAGVTKILLQMKHGQIVPSLHSRELNPNIDFERTPFVVQQQLGPWSRPRVTLDDGVEREYPRIAGISSFGAGGSNAHVIIEEYLAEQALSANDRPLMSPVVVPLSAKSVERLSVYSRLLLNYIESNDVDVRALAYTLQRGREAMPVRLAFTVSSVTELKQQLTQYLSNSQSAQYFAESKRHKRELSEFKRSNDQAARVASWIAADDLPVLLSWWVKGLELDWNSLWQQDKPRAISLPTYPFEQEKYWLPKIHKHNAEQALVARPVSAAIIAAPASDKAASSCESASEPQTVLDYLIQALSDITQIPTDTIDGDEALENYGVDSVVITRLNQELDAIFVDLSKTLFYEFQSLAEVAEHLSHQYPTECQQWVASANENKAPEAQVKGLADQARAAVEQFIAPAAAESHRVQAEATEDVDTGVIVDGVSLETLLLCPQWQSSPLSESPADNQSLAQAYEKHYVVLCGFDAVAVRAIDKQLQARLSQIKILALSDEGQGAAANYTGYAAQLLSYIQQILALKPKGEIRLQLLISADGKGDLYGGLTSLMKSAHYESPKLAIQVLAIEAGLSDRELVERVVAESSSSDRDVRYIDNRRETPRLQQMNGCAAKPGEIWQQGGVYLITGGAGGLGLLFAESIARAADSVTLILTGRSELSAEKQQQLQALEALGAWVEYRSLNVSDQSAVEDLVDELFHSYGNLTGVIHSAGVLQDSFLVRKTEAELRNVFEPKVAGVIALDEATKDHELDVFISFASTAGTFGNVGQTDYAAANAFLDAYARHRSELVAQGQRSGRSLSINWPLWADGGMQIDQASRDAQWQGAGLMPLEKMAGINALNQALLLESSQVAVLYGNAVKIRQVLLGISEAEYEASTTKNHGAEADSGLVAAGVEPLFLETNTDSSAEQILTQLMQLLSDITKLDIDRIEGDEPLENYGVDSVVITQLNQQLSKYYPDLSKTLFYEYQSLEQVSEHLASEYDEQSRQWLNKLTGAMPVQTAVQNADMACNNGNSAKASIADNAVIVDSVVINASALAQEARVQTPVTQAYAKGYDSPGYQDAIAVIGVSGRYPKSPDLNAYWKNLQAGIDCIEEIPAERWSLDGFYLADQQQAIAQGKSYSKWGGLLEGLTEFDANFFNIPLREAENMDPQERLFIQTCWSAIEDGGYTCARLASQHDSEVGVFAGITKTGFALYCPDLWRLGEEGDQGTSFSSVANRVSYLFNLHGPSMPVDTMCSSSLTAIHQACEYILRGDCQLALAGGVNLYLHTSNYVSLCSDMMLSPDGKCKSFGAGANGFVPGEGVGAVLLKRLSQAEADGDNIHAIIRASAINHGGKTNGYRVPNPNAHTKLISRTLAKANIDPRTVSYVEAHGTGTDLGDPIEVTGLTQAFTEKTADTGYCALGSVKSNIGHCESAAGIAGLTKIILQMKHKKIAPSLHSEELNPNINFAKTPFKVQQSLTDWSRPIISGDDGVEQEVARIACLSSFGAGGANAHLIVEEYQQSDSAIDSPLTSDGNPRLIVISAAARSQLLQQAENIVCHIDNNDVQLEQLAYTLQIGREEMDFRLACVASSLAEVRVQLQAYIKGDYSCANLYVGDGAIKKNALADLSPLELSGLVESWVRKGKFSQIANVWVKGGHIDWAALWPLTQPKVISLPTYPFAERQCWPQSMQRLVDSYQQQDASSSVVKSVTGKASTGERTNMLLDLIRSLDSADGALLATELLDQEEVKLLQAIADKIDSINQSESVLGKLMDAAPKADDEVDSTEVVKVTESESESETDAVLQDVLPSSALHLLQQALQASDSRHVAELTRTYLVSVLIEHASGQAAAIADDDYLTSFGLDSINAISIKRRLAKDLAIDIDPTDLLNSTRLSNFVSDTLLALGVDIRTAVEEPAKEKLVLSDDYVAADDKDYVEVEL